MDEQHTVKTQLSVVSPVYRGEKTLDALTSRISAAVAPITTDYEIILVNDASPDRSWEKICQICRHDDRVVGLNLSRNFGQHAAITAGLACASGEWVVVMDCDLQDCPEEIPRLYAKAMEGYDSVLAQRMTRHDTLSKRLSSKLFYHVFSFLTETGQDASVANFGIYSRKVIDAVLRMGDALRYFPTQVQWVGFRQARLPVKHGTREEGHSNYNLRRLMHLATNTMLTFSSRPLRIIVKFGFLITLLSIIAGIYILIKWFAGGIAVLGYTSLIISIWFLAGVIISLLGIVGLYIGSIFEQVKNRPYYIVSETQNVRQA
ncbi:MAG: glycosyltransferase family 2 protein [Bacteroidales bacterium]|nr:glycosyltransferase family 2 protein [Bacteroidales bacterium]